ncbi:replicative DNA helicase [Arthrobacter monumenti]
MSLTHMDPAEASSREPEFARTPPQDLVAEQSVLGGMMLSKDAIADCVEVLRGNDFYRPAHESIYEAICDLYGRGEPADAVTVSDELTKRKEISRVGGPAYLHTLISSVPTAANASFYAEIVRERSVLRRLVDAGTKIVQLGYGNDGEVDDIVNAAQAEIYAVSERRTTEDYVALKDVIEGTVDEIEASGHRGTEMAGVPTGFYELDDLTHGLHPGQMIVIAARPAIGKALALDTPIPTPTGWTTMGQIQPGEQVLAADGTATDVVAATEVMIDRPCYQVTFDDGTTLVADEEHQWLTDTRASRKSAQAAVGYNRSKNQQTFASVKTTGEIAATLRCPTKDTRLNHSVNTTKALELPEADLPIGPYTLGAWLGDGHTKAARVTNEDDEVLMRISGEGYRLKQVAAEITWAISLEQEYLSEGDDSRDLSGSFQAILRRESLLGNKHIPGIYLRASVKQRRELLAGLLDTDGTVTGVGCVQFSVTHRRLADDARELIHSLGYRTGWSEKPVRGRSDDSSTAYTITFSTDDEVFGLHRKKVLHKERNCKATPKRTSRFIKSVERIDSVPVRCIQVAHTEHLYLAGKSFVPTHNSTLALDIARSAAIKHSLTTVVFSLEMSRNEIATKLLAAEATINLQDLRKGTIRDEQWSKIATTMGRMNDAPLFIDDSPNMSLMEIRAKCRRLKQRHDLKLVIIDYLQLMSSGKKVESRQQEVSEFSRALKLLAKELGVPVIALSQLNRGSEQRPDKKPMVSDLRESGSIEQDADMVVLLHREDIYDKESARAGEADVIVAKHRNGPTKTIVVGFQGHYSRFSNMAVEQ